MTHTGNLASSANPADSKLGSRTNTSLPLFRDLPLADQTLLVRRRPKAIRHRSRSGDGRGGAIRTLGLLNPIQVRYQAAPRPDRPKAYQTREAAQIRPIPCLIDVACRWKLAQTHRLVAPRRAPGPPALRRVAALAGSALDAAAHAVGRPVGGARVSRRLSPHERRAPPGLWRAEVFVSPGSVARPLAEDQPDRRAVEAEFGPKLVLEEALVAEVDLVGVAGEEDERRRRDRHLGRVEDLGRAELAGGRRLAQRRRARITRFSSGVEMRLRRSPQTSTASSSTLPTRWPVLALIETIGAKSRNGTSRAHGGRRTRRSVRSVFSASRSHLFRAMTRPRPSSATNPATCASWAVSPSNASMTRTATSARSTALRARSVE